MPQKNLFCLHDSIKNLSHPNNLFFLQKVGEKGSSEKFFLKDHFNEWFFNNGIIIKNLLNIFIFRVGVKITDSFFCVH